MSYTPNPSLERFMEAGDLSLAREMLQVILDNNTLPNEYVANTLEWAKAERPDILEPFDARLGEPDSDHSHWTPDYYFRQKAKTSDNFSLERFTHLIAVRNHLRACGDPRFGHTTEPSSPAAVRPQRVADALNTKKILIIAALSLAAVALVITILRMPS